MLFECIAVLKVICPKIYNKYCLILPIEETFLKQKHYSKTKKEVCSNKMQVCMLAYCLSTLL